MLTDVRGFHLVYSHKEPKVRQESLTLSVLF